MPYQRTLTTEIAGVRLRAPMMSIHTIAAGGGSLLQFDGVLYRVGPTAAGAQPWLLLLSAWRIADGD
jgi:5-oxoprolinase (ATP-hydrolysing)